MNGDLDYWYSYYQLSIFIFLPFFFQLRQSTPVERYYKINVCTKKNLYKQHSCFSVLFIALKFVNYELCLWVSNYNKSTNHVYIFQRHQ